MLVELVDKAESTSKKYWKWILGIAIALLLGLGLWLLKRQRDKIAVLEAEKLMLDERAKDKEAEARVAVHTGIAETLYTEAQKLRDEVAKRDETIVVAQKEYAEAKAVVDRAKNWQELEKQAKGAP